MPGSQNYQITGRWIPADNTQHRLELATTDNPDIVALRATFSPETVLFAPKQEVMNFAAAVTSGTYSSAGLHG